MVLWSWRCDNYRRTVASLCRSLHGRRSGRHGGLLLCLLCLLGLRRPRGRGRQTDAFMRGSSELMLLRLFAQRWLLPLLQRIGLRGRVLAMWRALRLLSMLLHRLHVVQRGRELQWVLTQARSRIRPLLTAGLRRLLRTVFLLLHALLKLLLLLQVRLLLLSEGCGHEGRREDRLRAQRSSIADAAAALLMLCLGLPLSLLLLLLEVVVRLGVVRRL